MKSKIEPYIPGILLFVIALVIGLTVYKNYGMAWDEPLQRDPALLSWNYATTGDLTLFKTATDNHGAAYELLLLFIEKKAGFTDTRDIYMMRHIVTHILFLLSALAGYVLIFRLFRNKWLAIIGFLMLVLQPRIYAHSYFNSKDLPFLCFVIFTMLFAQIAFDKKKWWWFLLAGLACGYGTGIRIMGIMYFLLVGGFILLDIMHQVRNKQNLKSTLISLGVFTVGFCVTLYSFWPYLWREPIAKFVESFNALSHFKWEGSVLVGGEFIKATELPWTYFPTWFIITNPILWLILGLWGAVWMIKDILLNFSAIWVPSRERNNLFYLLCFWGPILAVLGMHSVIYDDWRHLYFVYPAFVIIALYFLHRLETQKFIKYVYGVCGAQAALILYFMVANHPFQQTYFNSLVSHNDEYLRETYEMDYWGSSLYQGLQYLLEHDKSPVIKLSCNYNIIGKNNINMLPKEDRKRFQLVNDVKDADYFITNFRLHPQDYPSNNIEYSIKVLNSSIMNIYRFKK